LRVARGPVKFVEPYTTAERHVILNKRCPAVAQLRQVMTIVHPWVYYQPSPR
jgi:hypothetical protein